MSETNFNQQEWKQKSQGNAAYWLALQGFLSLLSCITQDHLFRGSTVPRELGPSTLIIIQKMPYRPACRQHNRGICQQRFLCVALVVLELAL